LSEEGESYFHFLRLFNRAKGELGILVGGMSQKRMFSEFLGVIIERAFFCGFVIFGVIAEKRIACYYEIFC
jgi:hypothetical protein